MLETTTSTVKCPPLAGPPQAVNARPLNPLRALAVRHRFRCYRDACGDWNIPGRWGEIFWYGAAHDGLPDRIGVQIGGPRANRSQTAVPLGSNKRINRVREMFGKPSQAGDGEAVFVIPAVRILEAARVIGAFRRRRGRAFTPEQRAQAAERLRRWRERRALAVGDSA